MSKIRSDRRAFACAAVCFSVATILSAEARAEPAEDPKALYREGARLYDVGDYEHAAELFQRAYVLTGAPMLLLNLAQAERLGGACAEAAASYRRYLEREPAERRRAEITRRITEMNECAAAKESRPSPRASEPLTTPPEPEPPKVASPPRTSPWRTVALRPSARAPSARWSEASRSRSRSTRSRISIASVRRTAHAHARPKRRLSAYETWRVVAAVGGIVAASGAAGAVFGFTRSSPRPPTTSRAVAIAPWIGLGGAGLHGTFE